MPSTCPNCGTEASGRFCSNCGTNLDTPSTCGNCGHAPPVGARFCNMCGTGLQAGAASAPAAATQRNGARLPIPWIAAAAAIVILLGVLLLPRLRQETSQPGQAFMPADAAAGDARGVDLSSMTPREAADRLFNRVMQAYANGDSAQSRMFLPMAIAAYEQVDPLDLDGHYHLAVLHLVNQDAVAARREAGTILSRDSSHLFGLFTAGQAEEALGRPGEAQAFFARFLENYETERGRALPEYSEHEPAFPSMLEEARRVAGTS